MVLTRPSRDGCRFLTQNSTADQTKSNSGLADRVVTPQWHASQLETVVVFFACRYTYAVGGMVRRKRGQTVICMCNVASSTFSLQICFPIRIYSTGNSSRFPKGKPAATESH